MIAGEDHPSSETKAIEIEIIQEQNEVVGKATKAAWDAYMFSYNVQQNAQLQQAQMNIDMFDSPEDIEQSIDIICETAGFATAVYDVAILAIGANPPVGAIILGIGGVIWCGRQIYRACQ